MKSGRTQMPGWRRNAVGSRGLAQSHFVPPAELLTVPAQASDRRPMQDYELYLTNFPILSPIPLDNSLARKAALVRTKTGQRMPGAIQIAAVRTSGADAIVTNDRRWLKKVTGPALVLLDDYLGNASTTNC